MTYLATILVAIAVVTALLDWFAVATNNRTIELQAKPFVMVFLIAAAVALDPIDNAARWIFVVGLVMGLLGDALLLGAAPGADPRRAQGLFIAGLTAFLLGHVYYGAGFIVAGLSWTVTGFAAIALLGVLVTIGAQIGVAAWRSDRRLGVGVACYLVVIGTMTALGVGTKDALAIIGVTLFAVSDAMLGWNRFVAETEAPLRRTAVHATYHGAQIALVLWLAN